VNQLVSNGLSDYRMPLKDGSLFELQDNDLQMYKQVYTSIDVDTELRKMIAWLVSNPSKRKTRRGVLKFVNSWLNRAKPEIKPIAQSQKEYVKQTSISERINNLDWAADL